jgi:hypothetical protein
LAVPQERTIPGYARENRFGQIVYISILSGIMTVFISLLLLSFVPFVNSQFPKQKIIRFSGILVNQGKETGRGGGNEQYFYAILEKAPGTEL